MAQFLGDDRGQHDFFEQEGQKINLTDLHQVANRLVSAMTRSTNPTFALRGHSFG